jgi:hypothetical protein
LQGLAFCVSTPSGPILNLNFDLAIMSPSATSAIGSLAMVAILVASHSDVVTIDLGLEIDALIIDGNDILNNIGIICPPRSLIHQFLITTSPSVLGGEILGFGRGLLQGFIMCLSDISRVTALMILLEIRHLKSELDGDGKLTFSAARISSSVLFISSIMNPSCDAAIINSFPVCVKIPSSLSPDSSICAQNLPS